MVRLVLLAALGAVAMAQQPPAQQQQRQPAEGRQGSSLGIPDLEMCKNRPKLLEFGGKSYYFSWDLTENQTGPDVLGNPSGKKVDWLEARNECRLRCMDTLSIETYQENEWVKDFIKKRKIPYIWTSGRLCDFPGCETRKDLQPVEVYGWFWPATDKKIAPTNATIPRGWPYRPWSTTGHFNSSQPDNAELRVNKTPESCLAVANNLYEDGIQWHDIACYHPKPYICEDNPALLDYVRNVTGVKFL